MSLSRIWITTGRLTIWAASFCIGLLLCGPVAAQKIQAFSSGGMGEAVPAPWRMVGLPGGKHPLPKLDIVSLDGERVLRIAGDKSYGSVVHDLSPVVPGPGSLLRWRWRLDQALLLTDLTRKDGDDSPLKVCVMFDLPLEKLGLVERSIMRIARSRTADFVPAATICYIWDHLLPVGTELPNVYSPRLHYVVMDSGEKKLRQWVKHERDVTADFLRAFGRETDVVPPVVGVLVGADSDNTASTSLGYVGDVTFTATPKP